MFKNSYQSGLLSVFYSCGTNPLTLWDMTVKNGHIKRVKDAEVNSIVLEISSTNVSTTFITCPKVGELGIKLPFLVIILKNMKRYFSFEVTILDDSKMRRRFRISNFQSTTKIKPFCTSMPIGLSGGWNQVQFNLSDFTKRAYGTHYVETLRIQVHANIRLRRIYFCDRLYMEEELPQDYKLYLPLQKKAMKATKDNKSKEVTETKLQRTSLAAAAPEEKPSKQPSVQKVSPAQSIENMTPAPTETGDEKPLDDETTLAPETVASLDKIDEELGPGEETKDEEKIEEAGGEEQTEVAEQPPDSEEPQLEQEPQPEPEPEPEA